MQQPPEQKSSDSVFEPKSCDSAIVLDGVPIIDLRGISPIDLRGIPISTDSVSTVVLRSIGSVPANLSPIPIEQLLTDFASSPHSEDLEKFIEVEKRAADLRKQSRPYSRFETAETWSSRWITSQIIYLFPELRHEELLGDLYETNRRMFLKNYPRWSVNLNNVMRAIELIESGLRVKLLEWLSLWKKIE